MLEIPRLEMPVHQSPVRHLLDCPFRRAFVIRRAGQTRTVNVCEHVHGLENLRMLHAFFANASANIVVALRLLRKSWQAKKRQN